VQRRSRSDGIRSQEAAPNSILLGCIQRIDMAAYTLQQLGFGAFDMAEEREHLRPQPNGTVVIVRHSVDTITISHVPYICFLVE